MRRDGGKFIASDFVNGKEVYAVNIEKIMNKIKTRHVAKIIERRYDLIAGRIFRILKKYKFLDEKAVKYIEYVLVLIIAIKGQRHLSLECQRLVTLS